MAKIERDSDEYRKSAISVAFSYAPRIYPCYHCGYAVADGYCCNNCGSSDPKGYDAKHASEIK